MIWIEDKSDYVIVKIPKGMGFDAPTEIARALFAWRYGLSEKEVGVLHQTGLGLNVAIIAENLNISEDRTIKRNWDSILAKMHAHKKERAIALAATYGVFTGIWNNTRK